MKINEKNYDIGFADYDELSSLQQNLLKDHVDYCRQYSPYYKRIKDKLVDLSSLPFTAKEDVEKYNDEFLAVDESKIVDIVMSSGTTGKATKIMYTEKDLERLAYNEKKSFIGCGITQADIVLLTCTIDRCFVAGLAYFSGLRSLGAATIRNGHGTMESHMHMIDIHAPTVIVGVPTFIRKLGDYLLANGVDIHGSSVTKIVCIGEPLRDRNMQLLKVASDIEKMWGAKVYSTYASSEIVTTFCECEAQYGGHLHPDLAMVEIIDENEEVLGAGEIGEVVVTPFAIEGMPLIRFKTGDVSFLINEACSCGRKSTRLGPIIGRKKQMLKIKGTTVYPQAIYSVLSEIDGVADYYIEVFKEDDLSDDVVIHIAVDSQGLELDNVVEKMQAQLRVKLKMIVDEPEELRKVVYTPKSRKPIRFLDRRN